MKMKGPPQRLTGYGIPIPLSVKLNGFCVVCFFPLELELPTRGRRGRGRAQEGSARGLGGGGSPKQASPDPGGNPLITRVKTKIESSRDLIRFGTQPRTSSFVEDLWSLYV